MPAGPDEREQPARRCVADDVVEVGAQSLALALAADHRPLEAARDADRSTRRAPRAGTPATGRDLPLSVSSSGSVGRRRRGRAGACPSPSRISPAPAACSSRAATFTASPVTSVSPSPATTAPVLTPIRASSPSSVDDVAQLDRRACRAQRVVLARDGDPEHRHHRVADELLDGAAVPLEHGARRLVVAVHQRARSASGSVRSPIAVEPGQVAEQHRDDLPHLARRDRGERRAATGAEPEVVGALAPARRADRHEASLRPAQEPVNDLRTRQE